MDKQIKNTAKIKRRIIWISAGTLITALIVYQLAFADHSSKLNIDIEKHTVAEVIFDEFQDFMTQTGRVEPIKTVLIDAEEGGRVDEILIEEGNMVSKGDVILRLSNADLLLRVAQAQSSFAEQGNRLRDTKIMMEQQKLTLKTQIMSVQKQLNTNQRNYKRSKVFYDQKLISEEEYLVAKEEYNLSLNTYNTILERQKQDSLFRENQVATMQSALDRIENNLEIVTDKIASLNVKAPVDGLLATLNAEIGQQIVGRGTSIGQVHVLTNYKMSALIDEHFIDRIREGLNASYDRNDKDYHLIIDKVYPEVRGGQFQIDLIFTDTIPPNIRTGQQERLKIELGDPSMATLLPMGAFFTSTGGQWVYVVSEDGTYAYRRDITVGRKNPRYYEITAGLDPGEKVITSGYNNFNENDKLIFK
ncbi:efflux RND transporter periplasmic adaptor subunit [Bacteroidota bacterium]